MPYQSNEFFFSYLYRTITLKRLLTLNWCYFAWGKDPRTETNEIFILFCSPNFNTIHVRLYFNKLKADIRHPSQNKKIIVLPEKSTDWKVLKSLLISHCISLTIFTSPVLTPFIRNHKKRKESLETRAVFSWILVLTWNFGCGRSYSVSTFFKKASSSWLWCY